MCGAAEAAVGGVEGAEVRRGGLDGFGGGVLLSVFAALVGVSLGEGVDEGEAVGEVLGGVAEVGGEGACDVLVELGVGVEGAGFGDEFRDGERAEHVGK